MLQKTKQNKNKNISMNDTRQQPKYMEKYDIFSQNSLSLQLHKGSK